MFDWFWSRFVAQFVKGLRAKGFVIVPIEPDNDMLEAGVNTPDMQAVDKMIVVASMHGAGIPREHSPPKNSPLQQAWRAMAIKGARGG